MPTASRRRRARVAYGTTPHRRTAPPGMTATGTERPAAANPQPTRPRHPSSCAPCPAVTTAAPGNAPILAHCVNRHKTENAQTKKFIKSILRHRRQCRRGEISVEPERPMMSQAAAFRRRRAAAGTARVRGPPPCATARRNGIQECRKPSQWQAETATAGRTGRPVGTSTHPLAFRLRATRSLPMPATC